MQHYKGIYVQKPSEEHDETISELNERIQNLKEGWEQCSRRLCASEGKTSRIEALLRACKEVIENILVVCNPGPVTQHAENILTKLKDAIK